MPSVIRVLIVTHVAVRALSSMVCVPIRAQQQVIGVFGIFSSRSHAFAHLNSSYLVGLSEEIAVVIEPGPCEWCQTEGAGAI
jgi:putative methionine-R-sulfoxide reductase with GAF domain